MKKSHPILMFFGIFMAVLLFLTAAVLIFYTFREYRPPAVSSIRVQTVTPSLSEGDRLTLLTFNTGYGGLSQNEDFFMDGGTKVQPDNKELVEENLNGISDILRSTPADVYFLQEVDRNSKRSYYIDEQTWYENALSLTGLYSLNFKCDFVPYPLPPIGKVDSGILTLTSLPYSEASRISLPESFSWPVSTCNLKRCLQKIRIPLTNGKELVLINFHLEAYDSGEGKIAQTKMLSEILTEEYEAGNYVIAGGDFNQTFDTVTKYPVHNQENWTPGTISEADLPDHFSFAVDDSYPTCRLLNAPYTGDYETSQVYVIDGFIVSDNLDVNQVQVINTDFRYTDHQPVKLEVTLLKAL